MENLLNKHINRFPVHESERGLQRLMEGNTSVQIIIIDCLFRQAKFYGW